MQRLMLSLVLCLGSSAAYAQTAANFPGPKPDGSVQLPNQWRLMPTGKHTTLGDLPVTLALHPKGPYVVALHCGYGTHEVVVAKIEGDTTQIVSRVAMPQAFHGLSFDAAGENLFVSGGEFEVVRSYPFTNGQLGKPTELKVVDKAKTFVPAGIAMLPDGKRLATAGMLGNAMAVVDLAGGKSARVLDLGEGSYPFGVLALNNGKVLVSLWGKTSVALVDVDAMKVEATWDMGHAHPAEMALTKDGSTLFVACANSTMVAVVDMATGKVLKSLNCALYPKAPNGNTPGSLALSSDGKLLAVANADANNLALFGLEQPRDPKALGFIPTGWYPTSVRFHPDGRLLVTNGKGVSSRANPQGPNPLVKNQPVRQYIGGLFQGTLEVIEAPTPSASPSGLPKPTPAVHCAQTLARSSHSRKATRFPRVSVIHHRSAIAFTLSRKTAPTIRCSETWFPVTAKKACASSRRRSPPTTMPWHANMCNLIIVMSMARFQPTATNGQWALMRQTLSKRYGPWATEAAP
jgi:DNA-binding beta-propeller fold protein YncE